jgi:hypothetical protein
MGKSFLAFFFAVSCWLGTFTTHAATIDLGLTGVVGNGAFSSQDWGQNHYELWSLVLLPWNFDPVSISNSDTVNATLPLDSSVVVPASQTITEIDLFLFSPTFPNISTANYGTISVFENGSLVASNSAGTYSSGQITQGALFPANYSFTMNYLTTSLTMMQLDQPVEVNSAMLRYVLVSLAVPLPAGAWLLAKRSWTTDWLPS